MDSSTVIVKDGPVHGLERSGAGTGDIYFLGRFGRVERSGLDFSSDATAGEASPV